MASESEIEEERRLFYVAMTRAKKVLQLTFSSTRTRNGKHESNSPSRFVREVDPRYVENPLTGDSGDDEKPVSSFEGWGRTRSFGRSGQSYRYGSSGPVRTEKPSSNVGKVHQPSPVRNSSPMPVRRPQAVPKRVPDAEFEPTPVLQLKAGQRIEHNRFGYGRILELTGTAADLKAKIAFDDHGEKILLLKYAKIRALNLAE